MKCKHELILYQLILLKKNLKKMSLITQIFCLTPCFKRIAFFSCLCNKVRLNRIQYYSAISGKNVRCERFNPAIIEKRRYSVIMWFQHSLEKFYQAVSDILTGRFRYIPVLGSGKFKLSGYMWYLTLDDVDVSEFFTLFDMPDTFYSRFKVLELHVWMLLFCLPQGSRVQNLVKCGLIEAMWKDLENRAKLLEKHNESFKDDMSVLYEEFKVNLFFYDLGFYKDDVSLSNALWYCFFEKRDVDPRLLEALVYFIRYQINSVQRLDLEKVITNNEKIKNKIWLSPRPFVDCILNYSNSRGVVRIKN